MLAEKVFDLADQRQFAAVSGDFNPMHLDAVQARRTQAGAPVVHGIHLLLWALESLSSAQPELPPLRSLRVQFNSFVYLHEPVQVLLVKLEAARARLTVSAANGPRLRITIDFGTATLDSPAWSASPLRHITFSTAPCNLELGQMSGRSGCLSFVMTPADAAALFPAATQWLGARRVAALAASTHLVGMICPGLNSIYADLSINATREFSPRDFLAFRVTETDSRFRTVEQEIAGGGMAGIVRGFVRTPPVEQATMESLIGLIGPADFAGSLALIVGGSRGLGELTAKMIAAGGGHVIVTWKTGKEDAEKVSHEIRLSGGACHSLPYDVRRPVADQLATFAHTPTHAYYFATPTIYRPKSELFVADRLQEFLAVYVDGFWQLSQFLRSRQPRLSLFYPSSVFVTERPKGMTEYSMAKAAGETLCADMNLSQGPLHVTVSRLPRLPTDQTASTIAVEMASPIEIMLPIVREVQSWPK
jgi:acyl dehydratase